MKYILIICFTTAEFVNSITRHTFRVRKMWLCETCRFQKCTNMSSSFSDIFKLKVGIPQTLLGNARNVPPLYHHESSNIGFRQPPSRNARRFFENGTRSEMPPPRATVLPRRPYQHQLVDESFTTSIPFGNQIPAHSTPMQSFQGAKKPQNLLRPLTDSTPALSNWSAIGSTTCGSVRSFCSNNTEFIDTIFQRGFNKLLAKGRFNPEYEEFVSFRLWNKILKKNLYCIFIGHSTSQWVQNLCERSSIRTWTGGISPKSLFKTWYVEIASRDVLAFYFLFFMQSCDMAKSNERQIWQKSKYTSFFVQATSRHSTIT